MILQPCKTGMLDCVCAETFFVSFSGKARVVVYKNSKEQLVLRFNAVSSTYMDWFSNTRLLESPWDDIAGSTFNYFVIEGPCWNNECRAFHINFYYESCPKDEGWLSVSSTGDTDGCQWEKRYPGNSFIFSKIGRRVNYNQYSKSLWH